MDLCNVSILNLLPPNIANDNNVKMMAKAFDKTLLDIIKKIPEVAIIPNLILGKIVNETLIDLLAWQFHVDFYTPDLPLEIKIGLVQKSLDWHMRKGTPATIKEVVTQIFAEAKMQEWYEYGGLPYRFRIAINEFIPNKTQMEIVRAVNTVKNTRSYLDSLTSITEFTDEAHAAHDNFQATMKMHRKYNGEFRYDGSIKYDGGSVIPLG